MKLKNILERGADYQLQAKAEEEGMTTLMQKRNIKKWLKAKPP